MVRNYSIDGILGGSVGVGKLGVGEAGLEGVGGGVGGGGGGGGGANKRKFVGEFEIFFFFVLCMEKVPSFHGYS